MSGWQPIETAPMDGTIILGMYFVIGYEPDFSVMRWREPEGRWSGLCDGERSIRAQGDVFTDYHEPYCTHWMPLPDAPEVTS